MDYIIFILIGIALVIYCKKLRSRNSAQRETIERRIDLDARRKLAEHQIEQWYLREMSTNSEETLEVTFVRKGKVFLFRSDDGTDVELGPHGLLHPILGDVFRALKEFAG